MSQGISISVIIPLYNNRKYIRECIESVLNQTYAPHEIIVVNDGSKDGGEKIVEAFKQVTLINQQNQGVTAARRIGIEHATGDWIYFVDSDDTLYPEALAHLVEKANPDTDIIVGSAPYRKELNRDEYLDVLLKTEIRTGPVCKLFRKYLFEDGQALNMSRDIVRGEDMIMNLRLACRAKGKIITITSDDYNYRQHAGQTVTTFFSTSAFETMFYKELSATFSQEDYIKFLPGLVSRRIYAYHLILSKQKVTKDFQVKETPWFKDLQKDIEQIHYRMSIWEWLIMHVANCNNVKYICFVFSIHKRLSRKFSRIFA